MNHTQRVAHVARQRRSLTNAVARESVERYLKALAEEIASGEWVYGAKTLSARENYAMRR